MLFPNEADVAALASMDDALSAVRRALRTQATGRGENAARQRAHLGPMALNIWAGPLARSSQPTGRGRTRDGSAPRFMSPERDQRSSGCCSSITRGSFGACEADRLGQLRTGAATGVSVDLLARPGSRVLACLRAGYQAWTQVQAVAAVRELEHIRVWSRTPERAQQFVRRLRDEMDLPARTVAPRRGCHPGRRRGDDDRGHGPRPDGDRPTSRSARRAGGIEQSLTSRRRR